LAGAGGGFEGEGVVDGGGFDEAPSGGENFDVVVGGVGEVDVDGVVVGVAGAAVDEDAIGIGEALGDAFEVAADGGPHVLPRRAVEAGVGEGGEPGAEGGGADGKGSGVEAEEGAAIGGGEGDGVVEEAGEGFEGGEARGRRCGVAKVQGKTFQRRVYHAVKGVPWGGRG
jgi:hypothetical protein